MSAKPEPVIFVVDASVDITGALVAADREAQVLRGTASFVLVVPAENRVPDDQLTGFSEVLRLPMPQIRKSVRSLVAYFPQLWRTSRRLLAEMRRRDCRALQVNDFYLMHGAVLRLLGYRGTIVTWVRIDPGRFAILGRVWLRLAGWSSDRIVAVSHFISGRLPPRMDAIVAYEPCPAVEQSEPPPGRERRLVFVGNYIAGKGQDVAISAFHRIAEQYPAAGLCFYGRDMGLAKNRSYRAELEQQAFGGAGADRVAFHDALPELTPAYAGAYAALNLSENESFSLTCQEASARGLPVIATRSGGPAEIIDDGVTGFLVSVGDVDAIADRLRTLLDDPDLARTMGRRGALLIRERFPAQPFRDTLIEAFKL